MKRSLAIFFLSIAVQAYGQEESPNTSGQFIGIQINKLIREILNFSNTGSSTDNPYLLTFSSTSATGRGINLGLGYTVNHFQDGDTFTRRDNESREFSLRVGWERKRALARRWIVSYGLDAVLESDNNWTKTFGNGSGDFSVETTTTRRGRGLGPRFTINFGLTDRMMIGTEATYYFVSGRHEHEVRSIFRTTDIDPVTGQPRTVTHTEVNDSSERFRRFSLDVPSVIFLIVKL